MSTLAATFTDALDGLGVESTRTTAAGFPDALAATVEGPAVGTPLPFDGVSLDGADVAVPPTPDQLRTAKTGVTPVFGGIAEYGSVVVESRPEGDELVALYPERHVAVLRESDLVAGVDDATDYLRERFEAGRDSAVLATGVSATADMGATVEGVHGPREVRVIVLSDR
ncbi:LUD domain-containing protein [Halolamina salifodinae]|uniref:L-lactate dehydrogenase complex protein LldG n=1 Tax=Halolamina salifodinae TaxID=1202767 RepID=A0A8T4GZA9_9EURY|nr:LUD domain-containing protein [Halolamina salifodinae]MBP1987760.1 L-lactate dehydrogenase complex protein LldG [Halolamina salifodinae]